ncbi:MAG TPA: hypothetical protein VI078_06960 [bacterium]
MAAGRFRGKKAAFTVAYAAAMVLLGVVGLKIIDRVVGAREASLGLESASPQLTIRSLELFPYEGFHVQANFRHRGPMPWELHTPEADFDVRTGDMGFFIDFSLKDPPPKAADEFRIILIGGSGAQGWGATSNEKMFYKLLEANLNGRSPPVGARVRVINLAMGGTITYQNFVALNRWGHTLEPDLILAYVGRNDFYVPLQHEAGTDAHTGFESLNAFALALRGEQYPPRLAWLVKLMPNVMSRTSIGLGIKLAWGWEYFRQTAWTSYWAARGLEPKDAKQVLDKTAIPLLVHSLRSIKRDFEGVPIMMVWQPIREEGPALIDHLGPNFYEEMFERTKRELDGFMNGRWYFYDLHSTSRLSTRGSFRFHLDDEAHQITGKLLADQVANIMPALLQDRSRRVAQGLPAGYGREEDGRR